LGAAVAGSVDSGKSTLVACLTHGAMGLPLLDNGHGSARMAVFRHKHEIESGRTSSLSQQLLGYAADGAPQLADDAPRFWRSQTCSCICRWTDRIVQSLWTPVRSSNMYRHAGSILNYEGVAALTPAEISQAAAHVLRFIDLGGHERFMKTALYGAQRWMSFT
jgi:GTPase